MSMRKLDVISAAALLLLSWYIVHESVRMPVEHGTLGPGFFPKLIGGCLAAFALTILFFALKNSDAGEKIAFPRSSLLCIVAVTAVYLWLLPEIGYLASTPGYLVITGLLISEDGKRYWKGIAINGVICTVILYGLFAQVLNVPLP